MMSVITELQASQDVTPDFKVVARKAGAFARTAVENSYQYPSYFSQDDFQQEALLAVLEAKISFDPLKNDNPEAWEVLKIKERFQALRRLAHKGHATLFEQVMIDLLRPDEVDALFAEQSEQQEGVAEKVETFLLVYDFAKTLTARQLKVFRGMYLGYSQAEIGKLVGVSQQTTAREEANIQKAFTVFALANGLTEWCLNQKVA